MPWVRRSKTWFSWCTSYHVCPRADPDWPRDMEAIGHYCPLSQFINILHKGLVCSTLPRVSAVNQLIGKHGQGRAPLPADVGTSAPCKTPNLQFLAQQARTLRLQPEVATRLPFHNWCFEICAQPKRVWPNTKCCSGYSAGVWEKKGCRDLLCSIFCRNSPYEAKPPPAMLSGLASFGDSLFRGQPLPINHRVNSGTRYYRELVFLRMSVIELNDTAFSAAVIAAEARWNFSGRQEINGRLVETGFRMFQPITCTGNNRQPLQCFMQTNAALYTEEIEVLTRGLVETKTRIHGGRSRIRSQKHTSRSGTKSKALHFPLPVESGSTRRFQKLVTTANNTTPWITSFSFARKLFFFFSFGNYVLIIALSFRIERLVFTLVYQESLLIAMMWSEGIENLFGDVSGVNENK